MKTKSNPRKDFTQVAFAVMQQATADSSKGGKSGGKARAEKLTPEERSKITKTKATKSSGVE